MPQSTTSQRNSMTPCLFPITNTPLATALLALLFTQWNYLEIESLSPSSYNSVTFHNAIFNRTPMGANQYHFPASIRLPYSCVNNGSNECLVYSKLLSNSIHYATTSSDNSNNEKNSIYVDSVKSKKSVVLITTIFERLRRMIFLVSIRWWKVKKFIRERTEKYTIYILECEDDKYYVGSTSHRKQRFKQHKAERGGSKWTRMHKPKRVLKEYRRVPALYHLGLEAKVTSECMLKYGINNVRGAMFAQPRLYTLDDLDSLTGFLGHYNDLNYNDVREDLKRILPPSFLDNETNESHHVKKNKIHKKKRKAKATDRCFKCGELGHFAYECPNDDEKR